MNSSNYDDLMNKIEHLEHKISTLKHNNEVLGTALYRTLEYKNKLWDKAVEEAGGLK